METVKLLALSGSLRKHSYNRTAILALMALSPEGVDIQLGDISQLPLFNPDLENDSIPPLDALKAALASADGLIIASPEYAHGISGPMKNALDWLVSGVEFPDKPIMLINTSPRASHAQAALIEVLTTMSGNVIHDANTAIPLLGRNMTVKDIVNCPSMEKALCAGLARFCHGITEQSKI